MTKTRISQFRIILQQRWIWIFFGLLTTGGASLNAGVLVSPTVVFVSQNNPTGRMTIHNPSDRPQEVNIKFSFGLPASDSLGRLTVKFQDSAVTDPRSALDWVRAFPRKVIVAPGENQTVRIMVDPPKGLPDGEYWARVLVRSQDADEPVPVAKEGEIATHLTMVTEMAIVLKYRAGELVSNLALSDASATQTDSTVGVWLEMDNLGNVSYMGVLQLWLKDADDKEIDHFRVNLAVYRTQRRQIHLKVTEGDFRKPYYVDVGISSEGRNDIDDRDMIAGNEISYSLLVE